MSGLPRNYLTVERYRKVLNEESDETIGKLLRRLSYRSLTGTRPTQCLVWSWKQHAKCAASVVDHRDIAEELGTSQGLERWTKRHDLALASNCLA